MGISTHVLDTARGKPAAGVSVSLEVRSRGAEGESWKPVRAGVTDADGRVRSLLPEGVSEPEAGAYRVTFGVGAYYAARSEPCFYPSVSIEFEVRVESEHYHVPLLLSPYGYSTYRGS